MAATPEFDTSSALLRVTTQHLLRGDESDIRVLEICEETQLSTSVIYGHFRSRQGLIDAALLAIYRDVVDSITRFLEMAGELARERGTFVAALFEVLADPAHDAEMARNRQMHLRISASALARPGLRARVLDIYDAHRARSEALLTRMIDEGRLSARLNPHQWALFFEGQMFARAFHDVTNTAPTHQDWRALAEHVGELDNV